jgi:antitoxin ParD1/3/4
MAITVIFCHSRDIKCHNFAMKSMNVSLPDSMRDYIDRQVQSGGYGSASEYVRDLIRRDQKRQTQEELENLLLEGLRSGHATDMSDRDWQDIRKAVRDKLNQQQDA